MLTFLASPKGYRLSAAATLTTLLVFTACEDGTQLASDDTSILAPSIPEMALYPPLADCPECEKRQPFGPERAMIRQQTDRMAGCENTIGHLNDTYAAEFYVIVEDPDSLWRNSDDEQVVGLTQEYPPESGYYVIWLSDAEMYEGGVLSSDRIFNLLRHEGTHAERHSRELGSWDLHDTGFWTEMYTCWPN